MISSNSSAEKTARPRPKRWFPIRRRGRPGVRLLRRTGWQSWLSSRQPLVRRRARCCAGRGCITRTSRNGPRRATLGHAPGLLIPASRRLFRRGRSIVVRSSGCVRRTSDLPPTSDSDGVGHHGKSVRALGDALREHGRLDPLEEVMTVAFDDLRGAGVATRTACSLTGRCPGQSLPPAAPSAGATSADTAVPAQGTHPGVEPR